MSKKNDEIEQLTAKTEEVQTVDVENKNEALSIEDKRFREKYITIFEGNDLISYEGLRKLAHDKIQKIFVNMISIPDETRRYAIARATVYSTDGKIWQAIGDASHENCAPEVVPYLIRIAEIRAKGRAMREMLGLDIIMLEEVFPHRGMSITQEQIQRIVQIMESRNISKEEGLSLLQRTLNKDSLRDLNAEEADIYIQNLMMFKKVS